jgi:hypothetical protein
MSLIRKKSVPSLACLLILVRGRGLEISSEGNSVSDESDIVRATVIRMTKNERKGIQFVHGLYIYSGLSI